MKKFSLKRISALLLLIGVSGSSVAAETVLFDPDGSPGGDNSILVTNFDWSPSSALAVGTLPLPMYPGSISSALLTHAKLTNFLNVSGLPIVSTGLNTAYEITFVAMAEQDGRLVTNATSSFALKKDRPSYFEVYWDAARNANELAGTGYNDGTLIMTGTITSLSATFTTKSTVPVPLDQFGADDYPTIDTGSGTGGGKVVVQVAFANPAFFPDPAQQPKTLYFNTSQILPYRQVDPSGLFADAPEGASTHVPVLGAVNGLAAAGGEDVIFQADSNMALTKIATPPGECRMTGGGVTDDGGVYLSAQGVQNSPTNNRYTFGGQIGAPTADPPSPKGNWTHHQFKGDAGDFVFHAGTASAPPETMIKTVSCSDPGYCSPARPAPNKQLDWEGVGTFLNARGPIAALVKTQHDKSGFTLHYVRVHTEDLGEPGPGGKFPHSEDCTHVIGTLVGNPQEDPELNGTMCKNCADVYQIEIHATQDPNSAIIYEVGGYMDNGNLQLHPPVGN